MGFSKGILESFRLPGVKRIFALVGQRTIFSQIFKIFGPLQNCINRINDISAGKNAYMESIFLKIESVA